MLFYWKVIIKQQTIFWLGMSFNQPRKNNAIFLFCFGAQWVTPQLFVLDYPVEKTTGMMEDHFIRLIKSETIPGKIIQISFCTTTLSTSMSLLDAPYLKKRPAPSHVQSLWSAVKQKMLKIHRFVSRKHQTHVGSKILTKVQNWVFIHNLSQSLTNLQLWVPNNNIVIQTSTLIGSQVLSCWVVDRNPLLQILLQTRFWNQKQ